MVGPFSSRNKEGKRSQRSPFSPRPLSALSLLPCTLSVAVGRRVRALTVRRHGRELSWVEGWGLSPTGLESLRPISVTRPLPSRRPLTPGPTCDVATGTTVRDLLLRRGVRVTVGPITRYRGGLWGAVCVCVPGTEPVRRRCPVGDVRDLYRNSGTTSESTRESK